MLPSLPSSDPGPLAIIPYSRGKKTQAVRDKNRSRSPRVGRLVPGRGVRGNLSALEQPKLHQARVRALHVPHQPYCFEEADDVAGKIELPPAEAVERRARERVVIVVPAFAQTQQT